MPAERILLAVSEGANSFLHPTPSDTRIGHVKRFIELDSDRFRLFRLPGYSPDLNLYEYLNNDTKIHVTGKNTRRTSLL